VYQGTWEQLTLELLQLERKERWVLVLMRRVRPQPQGLEMVLAVVLQTSWFGISPSIELMWCLSPIDD
jgi:hypothetical protein